MNRIAAFMLVSLAITGGSPRAGAQGVRELFVVPDLARTLEDWARHVRDYARRLSGPTGFVEERDRELLLHLDGYVAMVQQLNGLLENFLQNKNAIETHLVRLLRKSERVRRCIYVSDPMEPVLHRWGEVVNVQERVLAIVAREGHLIHHPYSDPHRDPPPWYWVPKPGIRPYGASGYGAP